MRLRIGNMTQRIVLLAPTASTDSAGAPTVSFATSSSLWAQKIEGATGNEQKGIDAVESSQRATLIIRYRSIDTRYRVRWGGFDWAILSADDTDGNRVAVKLELSRA